jgi:cytochrome c
VTNGVIGPAFADVAQRYRNDPTAADRLLRKVQAGGAGSFGTVAMPAQRLPERDLRTLIDWILDRLQ